MYYKILCSFIYTNIYLTTLPHSQRRMINEFTHVGRLSSGAAMVLRDDISSAFGREKPQCVDRLKPIIECP